MKMKVLLCFCLLASTSFGRPFPKDIPPGFSNLPDHVKEKFISDMLIEPGFDNLLLHSTDGEITTRCGDLEDAKFDLSGLEPYSVLSDDAVCVQDGGLPEPCHRSSLTFMKQVGQTKIIVSKHPNQDIKTIEVTQPGCSEVFQQVVPGIVTSIPIDAYDQDELKKFSFGESEEYNRNLRGTVATKKDVGALSNPKNTSEDQGQQAGRRLDPITCLSTKAVRLAMVFESSFCAEHGGDYDTALNDIVSTVANVEAIYTSDSCLRFELVYVEGFCDESIDPYKAGVDINLSGCGNEGLLDYFQDFWNANRATEKSFYNINTVQLASGTGLECGNGCVIGCAYINTLCSSTYGFGVNYLSFSTNQALRNNLLAHEIGHSAGSYHYAGDDIASKEYIMEPFINAGSDGFSGSTQDFFDGASHYCLDVLTPTMPTLPPTAPPTASPPTSAPVPPPTAQPTSPPTAPPTTSPPGPTPVTPPPTLQPTSPPTSAPVPPPTAQPTSPPPPPSFAPVPPPTAQPNSPPTAPPTTSPTAQPTSPPTAPPTTSPTAQPTSPPTAPPTTSPTAQPTSPPTAPPTTSPTAQPTSPPAPVPPSGPQCSPNSATCVVDADCCSNKCRGPQNGRRCKNGN